MAGGIYVLWNSQAKEKRLPVFFVEDCWPLPLGFQTPKLEEVFGPPKTYLRHLLRRYLEDYGYESFTKNRCCFVLDANRQDLAWAYADPDTCPLQRCWESCVKWLKPGVGLEIANKTFSFVPDHRSLGYDCVLEVYKVGGTLPVINMVVTSLSTSFFQVTFWFPINGGHLSPLKRSRIKPPNRSQPEEPGRVISPQLPIYFRQFTVRSHVIIFITIDWKQLVFLPHQTHPMPKKARHYLVP